MDGTFLVGAMTGLKAATELATGLIHAKNQAEINAKAIELQGIILSTQNDAFAASLAYMAVEKENRELKEKLMSVEAFVRDMKRYRMMEPQTGLIVYALKQSMADGEPAHYACTNCYQAGRKSILNCSVGASGWAYWTCANCKAAHQTGYRNASPAKYATEDALT